MSKHTPGPWAVYATSQGICGIGQDGAHLDPSKLDLLHAAGDYLVCSTEDARLIAAAPDLLEACRMAVGFCVTIRETDPDWYEHMEVGQLFGICTVAMHKAMGLPLEI